MPVLGQSIAVLPFVNMSDDPANEYFSDGMSEEIINALTRIRGLNVTARTSAFSFKGKNLDVRVIGRQLGVKSILEGSVRKGAGRVRITAQLIRCDDGFHLWSETFDRQLEDIFAVQDEISLLIADQVRENFGHLDIGDHLVDTPGIGVADYQLYLRGRYLLHRFNKEDIEEGIATLKTVVQNRPEFALAHAGIHYGYNMLAASGLMPVQEALTVGKSYLDRALVLDDRLPECHHSLGWHSLNWGWDFGRAASHLARAIELRPGYVDAHQKMFITLILEGESEAAFPHLQMAYRLDPLAALNNYFMGYYHYVTESLTEAHSYFLKTFEIEPSFGVGYSICALALGLQGQPQEILRIAGQMPAMKGAAEERLIMETLSHAVSNDTVKVAAGKQKLWQALAGEHQERVRFFLIHIETICGNPAAAFDLIEHGVDRREPLMTLLKVDPLLRPLHGDPRWDAMLGTVYAQRSTVVRQTDAATTPPLQSKEAEVDRKRLLSLMETQNPHHDPNLSLRDLAALLDIHPNRLSRLLNEKLGQNYNEFVNLYRLEDFKRKVQEPQNKHLTFLGLALECGFNSKTVFNAFFKKTLGMTPRSWLKSQK